MPFPTTPRASRLPLFTDHGCPCLSDADRHWQRDVVYVSPQDSPSYVGGGSNSGMLYTRQALCQNSYVAIASMHERITKQRSGPF